MRQPHKAIVVTAWLVAVAPTVPFLAAFFAPCDGWGCWALGMFFYWALVAAVAGTVALLIVALVLKLKHARTAPVLFAVPVAMIPVGWLLILELTR